MAFKCTRKRFVIETLHLDVDGGVAERRTTAPSALAHIDATDRKRNEVEDGPSLKHLARVNVEMAETNEAGALSQPPAKPKSKKRVAFDSSRPDLYDF